MKFLLRIKKTNKQDQIKAFRQQIEAFETQLTQLKITKIMKTTHWVRWVLQGALRA